MVLPFVPATRDKSKYLKIIIHEKRVALQSRLGYALATLYPINFSNRNAC